MSRNKNSRLHRRKFYVFMYKLLICFSENATLKNVIAFSIVWSVLFHSFEIFFVCLFGLINKFNFQENHIAFQYGVKFLSIIFTNLNFEKCLLSFLQIQVSWINHELTIFREKTPGHILKMSGSYPLRKKFSLYF